LLDDEDLDLLDDEDLAPDRREQPGRGAHVTDRPTRDRSASPDAPGRGSRPDPAARPGPGTDEPWVIGD
jgi:hypothetical protein